MKTALCSAVAALCAAALLSSIEAEGNLPLPAPLPRCPSDQQISQSALSYWLSPSLFLSVNTSPSLFLSFREMPLLPCPAPSVSCFSRLASRTVAPSFCLSGVLSTPLHRQDVGQLVWPSGRSALRSPLPLAGSPAWPRPWRCPQDGPRRSGLWPLLVMLREETENLLPNNQQL